MRLPIAVLTAVTVGVLAASAQTTSGVDPIDYLAKSAAPITTVPELEAYLKPKTIDEVDKAYPLPQDPKTIQKVRADRLKQLRADTVDVYNKFGSTKAAWADKARTAMEAFCLAYTRSAVTDKGPYCQAFFKALKNLEGIDCGDPLIRYWMLQYSPRSATEESLPKYVAAVDALEKSKYTRLTFHAAYQTYAIAYQLARKADTAVTAEDLENRHQQYRTALKAMITDPRPAYWADALPLLTLEVQLHMESGKSRLGAWRDVDDRLEGMEAVPWVRAALEGRVLVLAAWDARGNGAGNTVDAEAFEIFKDRLATAQQKLEAAWQADSTLAAPATHMLDVAKGLGFEREAMETWFRRAMEADPDNLTACEAKKDWLQLKWRGKPKDALAFTYQCLRTNNYYAHLPFLAETPQLAVLPVEKQELIEEYTGRAGTWTPVQVIYEAHLARYPDDVWAHTRYAQRSGLWGKWDVADAQFKALGGKPWPGIFAKDEFTRLAQKAKDEATKK
ncbi:hypothetical protein [Limnoglobus roseus]|uniref:hypothetical protein n=1 Tax=Limnoglobus roseus TaxID=2598579 RepID=UPI0011EAE227|nr:hypothetical protein [Limnoglobus roseus]